MKNSPAFFILSALMLPTAAFAYSISTVKVSGDKQAEIRIETGTAPTPKPELEVKDRVLTVTFTGAELAGEKLSLPSPHPLLSLLSVDSPAKGTVQVHVTAVNPTKLKERVSLEPNEHGVRLVVSSTPLVAAAQVSSTAPDTKSAAAPAPTKNTQASLLAEEQLPLTTEATPTRAVGPSYHWRDFLLMVLVFAAAGIGSAAFVKFLKRKGQTGGTRRFLIEQLSYCSLGGKSGVSLLKIGKEFVLVGVTPEQVTLLSQMPELAAQYAEEAQFERGAFKQAVNEELSRIQAGPRVVA